MVAITRQVSKKGQLSSFLYKNAQPAQVSNKLVLKVNEPKAKQQPYSPLLEDLIVQALLSSPNLPKFPLPLLSPARMLDLLRVATP
jgi:hypothetical protein